MVLLFGMKLQPDHFLDNLEVLECLILILFAAHPSEAGRPLWCLYPLPGPSGVQSWHVARVWCRFVCSKLLVCYRLVLKYGKDGVVVTAVNRLNVQGLENLREPPVLSTNPKMDLKVNLKVGLKDRRNAGIALVTVLAVTMLVLGLLTLITGLTTRSARLTRTDAATTALAQLADGYSDVARVVLTENLRLSQLPANAWLDLISADRKNAGVINPVDPKVVKLAGNHRLESDGASLGWEIKSVSTPSERAPWVRVAATAEDSSGRSQTVLRRVQFDPNSIFDLAMLADDVNCMFCHLKVEGDVGSIHAFRPGAGLESGGGTCQIPGSSCGIGSGERSVIEGDVFVASTFTRDKPSDDHSANGTVITGRKYEKYSGERLPKNDTTGATEFPGLDRSAAQTGAKGKLSGGSVSGVAAGQRWAAKSSLTAVNGFYDGNLVLIGTKENPIKLEGDVYASGDVVIKGVLKGQGAIYAGRNVYIAGDLTNQNRADKPGVDVCRGISSPDECARKNIAAGKDEVRISAGNNIVLGNFTEKDAKDNPLSRRDVQAAAYFREQFGLAYAYPLFTPQKRAVRKGSGEELRVTEGNPNVDEDDTFTDQLGNPVPAKDVQRITGNDVYENLIAPGQTDETGRFSRWLSDGEYQEILGQEEVKHGLWRTRFRFDNPNDPKNGGVTPEQYKNSPDASIKAKRVTDLIAELEASGFPQDPKFLRDLATVIIENPKSLQDKEWIQDFSGKTVAGQQVSGRVSFDGSYLRVAMIEGYGYAKEVTQLDAFLYANNRIAGKLGARGGYLNGGLIARELGVLAPGRNGYNRKWLENPSVSNQKLSPEDQKAFKFCDRTARPTDSVDDADNDDSKPDAPTCNYAIRYDHRLRNGGYGFNLYRGTTGITADWSFDSNGSQKVDLTP